MIDEGFNAALLEPGPIGAFNAKKQRYIPEVLCSTLEEAGFLPSSVSAIGLFDVIEHIKDDHAFVRQIHNILQPGGLLYATVPAHEWLWSLSDITAQHFRRYNHKEIVVLLNDRFEVLFITYLFRVLTLPIYFMRSIPFQLGLTRQENLLFRIRTWHGWVSQTSVLTKLLKRKFSLSEVTAAGHKLPFCSSQKGCLIRCSSGCGNLSRLALMSKWKCEMRYRKKRKDV
jgi:SAM-dependent methyltransferase